ncbi:MAG: hypothetical protein LCH70_03300 [Proteobacteria bacterium]|nr:hypothetical protein [Pseudomonadota bacterium]
MTPTPQLRPLGLGGLCVGLGGLAAALLARQPVFAGAALSLLGLGIVFLGASRAARSSG